MRTYLNSGVCDILSREDLFITRLQTHAWPSVVRGLSCVLVGSKDSGKTFSYVVPLVSILFNHLAMRRNKLRSTNPSAIVICSNWKSAETAANLVRWLDPVGLLRSVCVHGALANEAKKILCMELLKGVDILITTLPCLKRMTEEREERDHFTVDIQLGKCSHLVFDDVDHTWRKFPDLVECVIDTWSGRLAFNSGQKVDDINDHVYMIKQCILTSSSWFQGIDDLTRKLDFLLPNVIISSFLEAAVAVKTSIILHLVRESHDFIQTALGLVRKLEQKTIIFAYNKDDMATLRQFLASVAIFVICVTPEDFRWELDKKLSDWRDSHSAVLLVCDNPFNPLLQHELCSAEVLIHTGVPPKRHQFGNRFSSLSDLHAPLKTEPGTCHVLLTDEAMAQSPYILEELKRLGVVITPEVEAIEEHVAQQLKLSVEAKDLCHYVKAYGICEVSRCPWRHHVIARDATSSLPSSGEVTLDVLTVFDASRYLVRLSSHTLDGKKKDLTKYYKILFLRLQAALDDAKKPLNVAEEGVVCAIFTPLSHWARAKIINVDFSTKNVKTLVFLLDEGATMSATLDKLYELPEHFLTMPQLAVEVYLCEIKPLDEDISWSSDASSYIHQLLTANKATTSYSGRVVLAIGSTLWLGPVCGTKNVLGTLVTQRSLKSSLLTLGYGVSNPHHLKCLHQLCAEAGIVISQEASAGRDKEWLSDYDKALQIILDSGLMTNVEAFSEVEEVASTKKGLTHENLSSEEPRKETICLNSESNRVSYSKERNLIAN